MLKQAVSIFWTPRHRDNIPFQADSKCCICWGVGLQEQAWFQIHFYDKVWYLPRKSSERSEKLRAASSCLVWFFSCSKIQKNI
jgi:hypothetical protein